LIVVSATSAPPFQPPRHQRNICHPFVNRFTRHTLPTVNRKHFLCISFALRPFANKKQTHNRMLLFVSIFLRHGRHFDYWNQPLNICMSVFCPHCHEAGLCCYLVIHIQNILHPAQLFYFHCVIFTDSHSYLLCT
jgi:hypothetical protein